MGAILVCVFWLAVFVGWAINLVSVITTASAGIPVTTLFIVKVAGIFAFPLGAILGLFF
jgi:hypothetical protein